MTAITWEQIAFIIGVLTGLAGLWYRVETRISKGAVDAKETAIAAAASAHKAHEALHAFKLDVAENYAKGALIKDVETRVLSRIDSVVTELREMRKDFHEAVMQMARSNSNEE